MLSKSSAVSLVIKLNRSARLAGLIAISHAGGLVCLWLAPVPMVGQVLITAPVILSAVYCLQRYALLSSPLSVVNLEWQAGGWLLTDRRNIQYSVSLAEGSMRSRRLTVLLFLTERGRTISVPIFRDMLDADDYRRLQQRLTISRDEPPAGQSPA